MPDVQSRQLGPESAQARQYGSRSAVSLSPLARESRTRFADAVNVVYAIEQFVVSTSRSVAITNTWCTPHTTETTAQGRSLEFTFTRNSRVAPRSSVSHD